MRYLLCLLMVLPLSGFGQAKRFDFEAFMVHDCINFVITQFAKKNDSVVCQLATRQLKPETKTIFIMKNDYLKDVPAQVNGYNIRLADIKEDADMLYRQQRDSSAVILYLSDGLAKHSYWTVWVMPMKAQRKTFKKTTVGYENGGFKAIFFFNDANAKFVFDRTECF